MTPLLCLATAIFFEARSEPIDGQYAVGEVILNRVEDTRYPDTVCKVVFEKQQFSFTHDGASDTMHEGEAKDLAISVASDLLCGETTGLTSTHYHATYVKPFWRKHFTLDGQIGNHIFYTNETKYR